ncbi:hypothetical protein V6N12_045774 [Hibiscus sabdariffa]|uniref:Retroviral polymerase SH3-like domain-containing protein n=1 Tax=Hibiscus sabdariffa TaxID=183260 RepID=A0ABR2G3P7_9ROSI
MSTKLELKSHKCTFVGYPKETKGYYFFNPKENKVFVALTRVFLEKEFLSNNGNGKNIELEEVQQQQVIEPEVEQTSQVVEENSTDLETQPLRRSTRELHEPERYGFLVTTHGDVILVDQDELKTYQEVVSSPDFEKWLEAMRSEMDSMSENQVWTLVEPPEGVKPIRCKWVFKKKTDMDGNPHFMIMKSGKWMSKPAFLNGELEEDVYMTQPEGFVTPGNATKVCLSQSTYIDKVLKRFSMEESKRGFLPMRHGISLSKEMCPLTPQERERMSQIPYASAIGSIMYAMICTRPDLSYALSMTSRYQANPGVVSWKSSKQDTIVDSTIEAEYIAASEAAKEAVWIKKFISELGVVPSISDAIELHCDNNGAIAQAKEPRSH